VPRKRGYRPGTVPPWLELGTPERGGSVVERMGALPDVCPETTAWLEARGLVASDFYRLCEVYDAHRAGHPPERALELAVRECQT
jgi:hypothetical protein